jgi:hypothetical protein
VPAKPAPGTPAPARRPLARLVADIVLCLAAVVAVVSLFRAQAGANTETADVLAGFSAADAAVGLGHDFLTVPDLSERSRS